MNLAMKIVASMAFLTSYGCLRRAPTAKDLSTVLGGGCPDGDAGGTGGDGSVSYGLMGCGGGDGQPTYGKVGKGDPSGEIPGPPHTGSPNAGGTTGGTSDEATGETCLTSCDVPTFAGLDKKTAESVALPEKYRALMQAIMHDPNLSDPQKGERLKDLAKEVSRESWDKTSGSQGDPGPSVMSLYNHGESLTPDEKKSGTAIDYGYRECTSKDGQNDDVNTQSSTWGGSGGANLNLPNVAGKLGDLLGSGGTIDVGVDGKYQKSNTNKTEKRQSEYDPPAEKRQVILKTVTPGGVTTSAPLNLVGTAIRSSGFALDTYYDVWSESSSPDLAPETWERELGRLHLQAAPQSQSRLEEIRRRELADFANAVVKYMIRDRATGDFIEIQATHVNSFSYVYDWFPRILRQLIEAKTAAVAAYKAALAGGAVRRTAMTSFLSSSRTELAQQVLATRRIQEITTEIEAAKAKFCPEPSATKERVAVLLAVETFDAVVPIFKAHVKVIRQFEPEVELMKYLANQGAGFGEARLLSATPPPSTEDACLLFDSLRDAATLRLETNRIQQADADAKAISTAAMSLVRDSDHQVRVADLTTALDAEAAQIAAAIARERVASHLTEALFAVTNGRRQLNDGLVPQIKAADGLTDAEKAVVVARVTARIEGEAKRLEQSLLTDGMSAYLVERSDRANSQLARVRSLLVGLPTRARATALFHWRGLVASAGMGIPDACFATERLLTPECWVVDMALNGASDKALLNFDRQLVELQRNVEIFLKTDYSK